MAKKQILYQPFQSRDPRFITLSELAGAISYKVPSQEPANADCPKGEWYCANPACVVREVTIFCKLRGEALPKMTCPACREPLKFHHWLRHETLVPYKEETVGGARASKTQPPDTSSAI